MTETRFKLRKDNTIEWWHEHPSNIYVCANMEMACELLNEQDQRIKELEEQLKLVCNADSITPHDSVKEILRDEIWGIDTVAGESAAAWHDYCVLDKVFREQYDNELWDNYD